MGHQVFFNLDGMTGGANGTNTILDHTLHLPKSGLRFGVDESGVPTGDLLSNKKGKEFDFWSDHKKFGDALKQNPELVPEFNEKFMVSHKHVDSKRDTPAAILKSARSGVTMEMYTDQDALHVHTFSQKNGKSCSNSYVFFDSTLSNTDSVYITGPVKLKDDQGEGEVPTHGAISLTQGDWPDGVNHPEWLDRKTLWGNLDIYQGYVAYKFKTDAKGSS